MLIVTHVHSTLGVSLMAAGIALWLLISRRPWWLLTLILCVPGGLVLNATVKQIFRRARPQFDEPLLSLTSYSFPSGHTAGATVLYGFLAVLLLTFVRQPSWRALIVTAATVMVALVALSRVYLGVHYLSDVAGAIFEGAVWLALCFWVVRALRRHIGVGPA